PLSDADLVRLVSDGQIVPTMESAAPVWFRHLASQCMHHDPEKRPSAAALSFAIRQQTTTPSLQSSNGKVTVHVVVRMARRLVDTQAFVTQDPYCVLMLGGSKASTKVDMDGDRAPVWNEEFVFDDVDVMNDQLELTIRHKGYLVVGAIGTSRIEMYDALEKVAEATAAGGGISTDAASFWFPVWNSHDSSGEIHVEFKFMGDVEALKKRFEVFNAPTTGQVGRISRLDELQRVWRRLEPQLTTVLQVKKVLGTVAAASMMGNPAGIAIAVAGVATVVLS
ncbi:hypothetical protein As57867_004211, partial [Aphanomyces stellatus]